MAWAEILNWLLVLLGFGFFGFPICFSMMKNLPGRGAAFGKIVALVFFGFVYWLLCSLGVIGNNLGSALMILIPFAALSIYLWIKNINEIKDWVDANKKQWLIPEMIFLISFALILLFRFADPGISGTEKPMEMTFINGILNSESFPPQDSWLSGYGISYYYFGYLLTTLLIRFSGVPAEVGFNLMLATVFALAASAAFALVNDLLHFARKDSASGAKQIHKTSFLAPLFLLITSNLEGLFEMLYSKGLFWSADGTSAFWQWLGLKELNEAPAFAPTWDITQRQGIWWWRASRVLSDTAVNGSSKEIINEFPFFSFYLGDLHPHVLGIPLVLLALALAFNAYLNYSKVKIPTFETEHRNWVDAAINILKMFQSSEVWFNAVCIGALIFMNTWDFPIYFAIYCGAYALAIYQQTGKLRDLLAAFVEKAIPFGIACLLLYFSFLNGLSSQAGGLIPSGVFTTRTTHLLIMFGLFFVPLVWWLIQNSKQAAPQLLSKTLKFVAILFLTLMVLETVIFAGLAWFNQIGPNLQTSDNKTLSNIGALMTLAGSAYAGVQGFDSFQSALSGYFNSRVLSFPVMLLLFGCLVLIFSMMLTKTSENSENKPVKQTALPSSDRFVSLILLLAFGLIIVPEFFYLKDFFGTRMNTIFKFYFQVWILFSIAAAYACGRINEKLAGKRKLVFAVPMILVIAASLIYPIHGIMGKITTVIQKTSGDAGLNALHLDGAQFLKTSRPDDWAGIEWLKTADSGVLVEKVGSSYTSDNAASTFSGKATVLGPINHESQWRGGYTEIGSREADVKAIYESRDWSLTAELIAEYQIRYVYVGSAERAAYSIQEQKFERNLKLVFESGGCKIYQVY